MKNSPIKRKLSFLRIIIGLAIIMVFLTPVLSHSEILTEDFFTDVSVHSYEPFDIQGNGTPIRIRSGEMIQIRTQSKFEINVTFSGDVELRINETKECLEECYLENHFRYQYTWQIEVNRSDVDIQATFGLPLDQITFPENVDQETLKFAYYNGGMNQWQFVNTWRNQSQNSLMAHTNHFSTWTIFGEITPQNQPFEANPNEMNNIEGNGTPIKVQAGNTYRFKTQNKFQLNVSFDKNVEMNITEPEQNQIQNRIQNLTQSMIQTRKYVQIEINDSSAEIQATLCFEFTNSELDDSIDPFKLQFAYYNEKTYKWEKVSSKVEEIENGKYMVSADTTHFSLWTVVAEEDQTEPTSTPGFILLFAMIPIISLAVLKKRK